MITSERDVFIGAHFTLEQKEAFRKEAERRRISMSALLATIVEDWLVAAPQEQLEDIRSNKRAPKKLEPLNPNEADVPLPFSN